MDDSLILPPFYLNLLQDNDGEIPTSEDTFKELSERMKEKENDHIITNLGYVLWEGKVVKKDIKKAAEYTEKAARMGNKVANFNLGVLEFKGEGFKQEDFGAASNWEKAVTEAIPEAYLNYASMVFSGRGTKMNLQRATKYYNLAYENMIPLAAYGLGMINYHGISCDKNLELAAKYLKEAADKAEYTPAMYQYGLMCFKGEGVPVSNKEGLKYIRIASNLNEPRALFMYAQLMQEGKAGQNPDMECVMSNYRKSAELGNFEARMVYAKYLLEGKYVEKNDKLALEYFLDCADNSKNSEAMYIAAQMYHDGKGCGDKNIRKSVEYFKKGAEAGYPLAQFKYSSLLKKGVPNVLLPDQELSLDYLKKAADNGVADAQYHYATVMKQGEEVRQDLEEASRYYLLAANQGHKQAQYNTGLYYDKGIIATRDPALAAKYYKLAADQGVKEAQLNYGLMLYTGDGIVKNVAESAEYFHQAALQGIPKAMYMYGSLLKEGCNGVVPNPKEAAKYLKKAAQSDIDKAQYLYGMMAYTGEGIDVDYEDASKYLKLAADKVYTNTKIPGYLY